MSNKQCGDCSRSASDGNLADVNGDTENEDLPEPFASEIEDQAFFTLPRWMSSRRRSKNRIKYIKVDVPLNAKDDDSKEQYPPTKGKKEKKNVEKSNSFISKLFKKHSSSTLPLNSIKSSPKIKPAKVHASHISASNTDIRSNVIISDTTVDFLKDRIPAMCGIRNHGNTCFMNAIIQCLSNTDSFSEYFVMDHYKLDFLRRNKVHAKKYGTRGEVTEQLGALLKSLWSCQYYSDVSSKFKTLVAKYGVQYEGSTQHDAQEFLLWLLDKVHEDLNAASKQKYKKPKSSHGRTDEAIAAETLANHLRCNNSFVHDLFQGQFRSSLCCSGCGRYSNTFDPYLCISLPVPHCQTMSVFLMLILLSEDSNILKVGFAIDPQTTISDFKKKLCSSFKLSKQNIILTEFDDGHFIRTFSDNDVITCMKDSMNIYALETPTQKSVNNSDGEKLILVLVNKLEKDSGSYEVFWRPFVVEVFRESTYKEIVKVILSLLHDIVKDIKTDLEELFSLRVIDGVPDHEVLSAIVDLPLYMPVIDSALSLCDEAYNRGPRHLKLALEWKKEAVNVLNITSCNYEEHSSALALKDKEEKTLTVPLIECFDLYVREEKLGIEDAWMCPYCRRRLPCIKQLSLWTVPDVLIVHLKRFRQAFCQRTKITTFVEFPHSGLSLSPYMAVRNKVTSQHVTGGTLSSMALWSPWKRSRSHQYSRCEDSVYDLYAVCNHHGSMQGGHYTAYCKNPVDGRWYLFDDTKVKEVKSSEVSTSDAYILFYQRSSLTAHSCASSSTSGYSTASSSSSVVPEHWAFRMPPFLRSMPQTSKSQDNLCDAGNTSSLDRRGNSSNRPFARASKAYTSVGHFSDTKTHSSKLTSEGDKYCNGEIPPIVDIPPPPPPPVKHYWTITSV